MTVAPGRHVVVVDGSNLATEGRTTPSLRQLDEAVRAYALEDPEAEIVVVVDASFEHRIDPSERKQLIDAELHGEVVSPPAGAIGRGDAFVLRIAERTGAIVLSNDSFQEFHAEHPWLFDKGRLVGGKPVPGVGWIFTPRIPVRGPKSRQAAGKAKGEDAQALSPPVKAAELAKAAKKIAGRRAPVLPDGSTPKVGDVWPAGSPAGAPALTAKKKPKKGESKDVPGKGAPAEKATAKKATAKKATAKKATAKKAAVATEKATAKKAAVAAEKGTAKKATAKKAAVAAEKASAKKAAVAAEKATASKEEPVAEKVVPAKAVPAKKQAAKKAAAKKATAKAAAKKSAAKSTADVAKRTAKKEAPEKAGAAMAATAAQESATLLPLGSNGAAKAKAARNTAAKNPAVQEAIGQALAEAFAPVGASDEHGRRGRGDQKHGKQDGKGGRRRRRSSSPPPAVNEPLAFITFVATYPCDSELEGEVVSFTSHGAMVDVELPGGGVLHSYIPLSAMGDPPPTKARQVLRRGERRRFVLVALDPPRRVAELALPEVVASQGAAQP